jgi:cytochrome c biogenesis protein ResB
LSIKYDPFEAAFIAWYIGGFGLIGALCFVFFISHQRVWAMIGERGENGFEVIIGGDTNRNEQGFGDKFNKIVEGLNPKQSDQTD